MTDAVPAPCMDQLLREARTHYHWLPKPVDQKLLHEIFDLMKWGPTSANCLPLRIVYIESEAAKAKLKPCLSAGNVEKTMAAPVCAILAYDTQFYNLLPKTFPHTDARSWFAGKEKAIYDTAFRNSSLQGAYFMLAARMLGLDCGPMSGFDEKKMNETFFPDGRFKVNFICNLGYGDPSKLQPRSPRLEFGEVCHIL